MFLKQAEISFLRNLERLPQELLDRILLLSLFSSPYGCDTHRVLHKIKQFSELKKFPRLQSQLSCFMRTELLRKEIQKRYNLYGDYKSACQGCQSSSSSDLSYIFRHCPVREPGLVSRIIVECPSCFQFLLDHGAVLPSYYNYQGESLLYIALVHKEKTVARKIACTSTIDDLISPMWLTAERVGPSALNIASSDDFDMNRDAPWSQNMDNTTSTLDYHSFMLSALKKHPLNRRIALAYVQSIHRKCPGTFEMP